MEKTEHGHLTWEPDIRSLEKPYFLGIYHAMEEDIRMGKLPPHTKLPPQRKLAEYLGLNLGTVTRAFRLCEQNGLTYAVTGKGTYVAPGELVQDAPPAQEEESYIDMGRIDSSFCLQPMLMENMRATLQRAGAESCLSQAPPLGMPRHLWAAQKWFARFSLYPKPGEIAVCAGTQAAFTALLTALFSPGDKIAVDSYTNPAFAGAAVRLGLRLVAVAGDGGGMRADQLRKQCNLHHIKGVYLSPSGSNPTNVLMSEKRRKELAEVMEKNKLLILEDDAYGFLSDGQKPLASMLPQQTFFISALPEALSQAMGVTFLSFPKEYAQQIAESLYFTVQSVAPVQVQMAVDMLESGALDTIISQKRRRSEERNDLFAVYFPDCFSGSHPLGLFRWLPLPQGVDGSLFEKKAMRQGLAVRCSSRFALGREEAQYIRVAICTPKDIATLEKGLGLLRRLWEQAHHEMR